MWHKDRQGVDQQLARALGKYWCQDVDHKVNGIVLLGDLCEFLGLVGARNGHLDQVNDEQVKNCIKKNNLLGKAR